MGGNVRACEGSPGAAQDSATPGTPAPSRSKKRRAEINAFKQNPDCRLFLCTDSGGVGLNLQNARVVVNCDLPWNPAKLEQRIARAWRKDQTRPVTVINLIAEDTIEHGMLETLAHKQGLADGVLDGIGELSEIKLKKGGQSFLSRLEQTLEAGKERCSKKRGASPAIPVDPPAALARGLQGSLGKRLLHCEEHFPSGDLPSKLYIVTDKLDPAAKSELRTQLERCYPAGQATDPGWLAEHVIHIDAASHAAMLQLQRAGLIRTAVRAKRDLLEPAPPGAPAPDPRLKSLVAERGEGLKAAAVLIGAGLHKLATPHQRHALLKTAQIRAIGLREEPPEDRLPDRHRNSPRNASRVSHQPRYPQRGAGNPVPESPRGSHRVAKQQRLAAATKIAASRAQSIPPAPHQHHDQLCNRRPANACLSCSTCWTRSGTGGTSASLPTPGR